MTNQLITNFFRPKAKSFDKNENDSRASSIERSTLKRCAPKPRSNPTNPACILAKRKCVASVPAPAKRKQVTSLLPPSDEVVDDSCNDDDGNDDNEIYIDELNDDDNNDVPSSIKQKIAHPCSLPSVPKTILQMEPKGKDRRLLELGRGTSIQMLRCYDEYPGLVMDPTGDYHHNFYMKESNYPTCRAIVYSYHGTVTTGANDEDEHDDDDVSDYIRKVGSTNNFRLRAELGYPPHSKFHKVLNLDFIPLEVDEANRTIFHEFARTVIDDPDVNQVSRKYFDMVMHRGGFALGIRKKMILKMLENGVAQRANCLTGQNEECFMMDQGRLDEWYKLVDKGFDFFKKIAVDFFGEDQMHNVNIEFVASWATALDLDPHNKLSTKKIVTEALNGFVPLDWDKVDLLPKPARPGATNAKDIFSTDYSELEKKEGRMKGKNKTSQARRYTILIFDQNGDPLFPNYGLDQFLVDDAGFVPAGEIWQWGSTGISKPQNDGDGIRPSSIWQRRRYSQYHFDCRYHPAKSYNSSYQQAVFVYKR